jgi:hypothetical protein
MDQRLGREDAEIGERECTCRLLHLALSNTKWREPKDGKWKAFGCSLSDSYAFALEARIFT